MTGKTGSLCVRRATYWCPELQAEDPAKKGVCSNFLCDTSPGDEIKMTGPAGKVMLMPEEDPNTDYIMVATGTGIAPYRGFIRRLFVEDTPAAEAYKGQAWLFLGVANSDALLYDDEFQEVKKKFPDNFRLDYALSREQTNKSGGKMYIQDKVEEYADEVFDKLDKGAHIYFCGLKGMMPGIQDMLKKVAEDKGLDYDEWLKGLKAKKRKYLSSQNIFLRSFGYPSHLTTCFRLQNGTSKSTKLISLVDATHIIVSFWKIVGVVVELSRIKLK